MGTLILTNCRYTVKIKAFDYLSNLVFNRKKHIVVFVKEVIKNSEKAK